MIDTGLPPRLTNILIIDDVESVRLEMRRNLKKIGLEGKRFRQKMVKRRLVSWKNTKTIETLPSL